MRKQSGLTRFQLHKSSHPPKRKGKVFAKNKKHSFKGVASSTQ